MNRLSAAQAVEQLIQEYGRLVFHTIYGLTGDWDESQDLTQDTFHQALKGIDAARAKSGELFHAKAWLLQIALNTVLMQRRRRNIFRFIPLSRLQKSDQADNERESDLDDVYNRAAAVQPGGYGVKDMENLETLVAEQDAVQRTLARLQEPLRVCLVLSIVGQFSSSEIARMLNLEEAAVRQRLSRARKQFQQLYQLESGEELSEQSTSPSGRVGDEIEGQRSHRRLVESRQRKQPTQTPLQTSGRDHAQRFYRNPAPTPLW